MELKNITAAEYMDLWEQARKTINEFVDASRDLKGGYGYAVGYMTCTIAGLIADIEDTAERERRLQNFLDKTQDFNREMMLRALRGEPQ